MAESRPPFHVMTKPIGPICNLRCRYCFYLEKEAMLGADDWRMPDDVLELYIRSYIASQDTPVISFAWQGGEPTMLGLDFFRRVVELQRKHLPAGRRVENSIQTNATLIDEDWAAFLARERFLVGVSIDGPQDLHDAYRVDRGGEGSFDRVMAAIERLKSHGTEFNTLTVVNRRNVREGRRVYNFLKGIGSTFLQFIPLVERVRGRMADNELTGPPQLDFGTGKLAPWCPRAREWGEFLIQVFDAWLEEDVGRVFVQLFDVQLGIHAGQPAALCVFMPECGFAVAMEHDGDIYACDHYVYPEYRLGNVADGDLREIVLQEKQMQFGRDKSATLPRYCRECEWLHHCYGECPKHRIRTTPDGEPGLNNLCEGYKAFFEHSAPVFRRMVELLRENRAPAEIMLERRRERAERERRFARVGRNDPCPCGSGRKFKNCCGRGR